MCCWENWYSGYASDAICPIIISFHPSPPITYTVNVAPPAWSRGRVPFILLSIVFDTSVDRVQAPLLKKERGDPL